MKKLSLFLLTVFIYASASTNYTFAGVKIVNEAVDLFNSRSNDKDKFSTKEIELINKFADYETKCTKNLKTKVISKRIYCIKVEEIFELGVFKEPQKYPDGFLGNCKSNNWNCIEKKSGEKVYMLFVKRGPIYHARKPGAMIEGMGWYEILYLKNLKKSMKTIERYLGNDPETYREFTSDSAKIYSLIKMNKGRIKMREALGFTKDDKVEEVIGSQFLLASFLNNDKLKAKKVKLNNDLKKRKILLEKYKVAISSYKKKLEEEKN